MQDIIGRDMASMSAIPICLLKYIIFQLCVARLIFKNIAMLYKYFAEFRSFEIFFNASKLLLLDQLVLLQLAQKFFFG